MVIPAGMPLICCIGTVGKFGYSDKSCSANQQINAIAFGRRINRFGLYVSAVLLQEYIRLANKNVIPILSASSQGYIAFQFQQSKNKNRLFLILTVKSQNLIDTLVAQGQKSIALLKEYRTALISEAVIGKIDIRGDVA